ncbi:MAG: polysaccharide deacetylase family protein [Flavobacterium sp.]|nr:polysaccharide deacetylase family protein [Flavobacterium sp.]
MFKKQLLLLKDKADFVSAMDLINNGDEILNSKNNYYFITFDDGLKEQYQFALPILDELQIPAVLFANSRNHEDKKVSTVHKIHLVRSIIAPSDFLKLLANQNNGIAISNSDYDKAKNCYVYDDQETALLKYWLNFKMNFSALEEIIKAIFDNYFDEHTVLEELYLSENEIVQLSKKGFLGSHTHNHYPTALLSEKEMEFELKNSKLFFEKLTNTAINMVAYPYGTPDSCTTQVAEIAKRVGYKYGFTTTRGVNTLENNLLLLNRYDCNELSGGKNYKNG